MNLAVEAVTDHAAIPAQPRYDLSDWLVLVLVTGGWVACWTFTFIHPSDAAFGICVGGTVTNALGFHALRVHDDKQPDRKDG